MGYRWRDTLAHEYAHLIIAQKSNNTVPIWLHEGIAKFEEERWYKAPGGFLDAYAETMLAKAYYSNKMITLDQMHPSMALLPSREAGATAFAEVLTIIQFLHSQHGGYENIRKLLESLANDDEMDEALKKVYGMTLKKLETRWRQYLSTRGLREKIGTAGLDISFKKNSKAAPKSEENSSSEEEELFLGKGKGAKFFKLGKLLKDRGRNKAALIEIEKAQAAVGKANPMVQNIVADLNIKMSRFADAKAALLPLLELYDGPAMTYYNLGKACMGLGEKAEAIKYFLQTVSINPFDPRSHANLAALYSDMGESEAAEKSAAIYQKLQSYLGKD